MRILKYLGIALVFGLIGGFVLFCLTPKAEATPWDVTTLGLESTTTTAVQVAAAYGLGGDATGTRLIVINEADSSAKQYNCTTGWDITTCGYAKAYDVSARTASAYGNFLSQNGSNWYVMDYNNKEVERYTLGTANEIDSATWNSAFSVGTQLSAPWGVAWSSTGTYMYVFGNGEIDQYYAPTRYSFASMSFYAVADISAYEGTPESGAFKSDGTKVFVSGASSEINEFTMSTGWNINTLSYTAVTSTSAVVTGQILKDDGTKMWGNFPSTDKIGLFAFEYTAPIAGAVVPTGRKKRSIMF